VRAEWIEPLLCVEKDERSNLLVESANERDNDEQKVMMMALASRGDGGSKETRRGTRKRAARV
jgi:hypothetical protein